MQLFLIDENISIIDSNKNWGQNKWKANIKCVLVA